MKITPIVTQSNSITTLRVQCLFVGDMTDSSDKALIAALGDPVVDLGGTYTDPNNTAFQFQFPVTQNFQGITTQLSSQVIRFMMALPNQQFPNLSAPIQGAMDCVTPHPSEALTVYYNIISQKIANAMAAMRQQTLAPVLSPITV